jgi:hypothetical protein
VDSLLALLGKSDQTLPRVNASLSCMVTLRQGPLQPNNVKNDAMSRKTTTRGQFARNIVHPYMDFCNDALGDVFN